MLGIIWGGISFIWLGYSILTAGNLMEEPGSIDYVAEGEAMRIYGFIGCALYVLAFCLILYSLYKRKQSIAAFLLSMLLGGGICGVYLFVLR